MAEIKDKKRGSISGRLSDDLRARLNRIASRFGVIDAVMLDDALTALADYVERTDKYERPMRMILDTEQIALERQVAAEPAPPGTIAIANSITRRLGQDEEARKAGPSLPRKSTPPPPAPTQVDQP